MTLSLVETTMTAFALFLLPTLGGWLLTHFFDFKPPAVVRLAFAIVLGVVIVSLTAYILALVWALSTTSILIAVLISFFGPLAFIRKFKTGDSFSFRSHLGALLGGTAVMTFLAFVFAQGVYEQDRAIVTKMVDNYADLALHVGIINGFAFGENFPAEHPALAGVRLSYPFIVDFHAALLVKLGLSLQASFFLQNIFIAFALVILFICFVQKLTQNRAAGWVALVLLFFNGGLGWTMLFQENSARFLSHDYSSFENLYRFNNSLIYWLVPMRSMLLITPMLCAVWLLWLEGIRYWLEQPTEKKTRLFAAAGAFTGLMPLVHAHSYMAIMASAGLFALMYRRWKEWVFFFVPALVLAIPQILLVTTGGGVQASKFLAFEFGWTKEHHGFIWYWFLNTGFFIPLLVAALIYLRRTQKISKDAVMFYAPFVFFFVVPNVLKLAPWIWDNIKILYVWFLGSLPFVAMLLVVAWQKGRAWRLGAGVLFVTLTLSSVLDFVRLFTKAPDLVVYSKEDLQFGDLLQQETATKSLIMSAPVHNSHVLLAGRRLYAGYPGVLWTHGLSIDGIEDEIMAVYQGGPKAEDILRNRKIEYLLVTPKEITWAKDRGFSINTDFLSRFPYQEFKDSVYGWDYRLYKIQN
ncbi:hypothetical protein [Bdellovibrio sp. HCB337]|uniref:hypothetical protein n=1 Tax=Bdellovibrio sp. HCB337 TaxID=3394358 RepID=UPI0039A47D74